MPNRTTSQETEASYPLLGNEYTRIAQSNNNFKALLTRTRTPEFGGRLTLVSGTPVMATVQLAKTVIFYTPYLNDQAPIFDGLGFNTLLFTEQNVALDATNFVLNNLYDLFIFLNGTTVTLGYGPAWASSIARSANLAYLNGVLVNASTITLRVNNTTTFSVQANQATYVGTAKATASGSTDFNFTGSGSGGSAVNLNLWNYYNRRAVSAAVVDSGASYTYLSATFRQARASTGNQINFVMGVAEDAIDISYHAISQYAGSGRNVSTGMAIDSTSAPQIFHVFQSGAANIAIGPMSTRYVFVPQMGSHFIAALEASDGANSNTFDSQSNNTLMGLLWM
jgi:hypothetical protein